MAQLPQTDSGGPGAGVDVTGTTKALQVDSSTQSCSSTGTGRHRLGIEQIDLPQGFHLTRSTAGLWTHVAAHCLTLGSSGLRKEGGGTTRALFQEPQLQRSPEWEEGRQGGQRRPGALSRSASRMPHPQGRGVPAVLGTATLGSTAAGRRASQSEGSGFGLSAQRGPRQATLAVFEGEGSGPSQLCLSCPSVVHPWWDSGGPLPSQTSPHGPSWTRQTFFPASRVEPPGPASHLASHLIVVGLCFFTFLFLSEVY